MKGSRRVVVGLALLALAVVPAGCKKTVKADRAEQSVIDVVSKQTDLMPEDVSCPEDVEAKVGATFDCHFTGDGVPYVAHVGITKVDGNDLVFEIKSEPVDEGKTTVRAEGAEQSVIDVVSKQTDFTPTDVSCPEGVEAKVGGRFDCHFTGPDGPYTAHMTITKVDGEKVVFQVRSRPSGG